MSDARPPIVVFAVTVAAAFTGALVVGGVVSLLLELGLFPGALRVVDRLGDIAVGLLAPWAFLAMVATPRLPARVVIPGLITVLWALLGAMPAPLWLGLGGIGPMVGAVSLVAGLLGGWALLRARDAGRLDRGPVGGWRHSLRVVVLSAVLVPLGVAVYGFWSVDVMLEEFTADYARLTPSGMELAHRTFVRGDERVDLMATMHIGRPEVYASLFDDIPAERAVLLFEGVTDDGGAGNHDPGTYDKVAERLGLEAQPRLVPPEGMEERHGDVDLAALSPRTQELIEHIFAIFTAGEPAERVEAVEAYTTLVADDPESWIAAFLDDAIHQRNLHLLQEIGTALDTFDTVVVPWGAGHMPELQTTLIDDGFVRQSEQWNLFISWTGG